jgi:hypothetical protein
MGERIPQPRTAPNTIEQATDRSNIIPKAVNDGDKVRNQSQSSAAAGPKTGRAFNMGTKYETNIWTS